jgi:acyl-CoA thioester hydrolase
MKNNMFTTSTQIRVRYAETDQMGVVYHSNYFPYFESARAESIRELGFTYADMEKMGVIMPVVDVHCRYLRPALYDDLLTVKTMLKELPVHHKIEFHHEVYNEKQELLVVGKIILYFMEAKGMKRTTMPDLLLEKLQAYFP